MLRLPPPRVFSAFCLAFLFLLPLVQLRGPSTTGVIGGTVYDPQHAVIPNARIVAINEANGATFVAYTDKSGNYTLADLPPGTYSVDITGDAFTAYTATHVVVELGRRTLVTTTLHIGATASTIHVGTIVPFQSTYPSIATNITQSQLHNMPSNSRRWSSFALLTPGVVSDQSGQGLLSFRGISGLLNNNTIDGADNNQAFFSEERGR
ncbi:MAG TPA: carboxypeptidase-like regulatory domain-containing protein, partial [Acetobacteraceae bacterium]|nr:carboxypeptidase-like regulatory domain-containing protein [Acetobacteraceae bacterium]